MEEDEDTEFEVDLSEEELNGVPLYMVGGSPQSSHTKTSYALSKFVRFHLLKSYSVLLARDERIDKRLSFVFAFPNFRLFCWDHLCTLGT